jgi:predicted methyltransferase
MLRATELAHLVVRQSVRPGDWAIDATVGNGHDTALLAGLVGPSGRVFGFDVQEAALSAAAQRLRGLEQVSLHLSGHERMASVLPTAARGRIAAVMFNLGYLPGGARAIVTEPQTTLAALDQALDLLAIRGIVTLVGYPGHPGGADEAAAVRARIEQLPDAFSAARWGRLNARAPVPDLLVVERVAGPARPPP